MLAEILAQREAVGSVAGTSLERGLSARSAEASSTPSVWIGTAEHASLPLQYVGNHVARLVASHVGESEMRIVPRPYDLGLAYGLSISIRDVDDDGGISGEMQLSNMDRERVDRERFELTSQEAQLSARDNPPQPPQRLRAVIDTLLERIRRASGDEPPQRR